MKMELRNFVIEIDDTEYKLSVCLGIDYFKPTISLYLEKKYRVIPKFSNKVYKYSITESTRLIYVEGEETIFELESEKKKLNEVLESRIEDVINKIKIIDELVSRYQSVILED